MSELIGPLTAEEWCSLRLGAPDDPLQCCADTSAVRDAVFGVLRMGGGEEHGMELLAAWPRFAEGHGEDLHTVDPRLSKLYEFYVKGKPPAPTDEELQTWITDMRLRSQRAAVREVFTRAGGGFTGDSEETLDWLLGEELAEIADKAEGSFRRKHEALRTGEAAVNVQYAVLNHLLTVVSALRLVLGYQPTPVGTEVVDQIRKQSNVSAETQPEAAGQKEVPVSRSVIGMETDIIAKAGALPDPKGMPPSDKPADRGTASGETMTVRVVDRGTGREYQYPTIRTVTIPTTCATCGGRRGAPYAHYFAEDGGWLTCDRWDNPRGHVDYYEAVLAEARAYREAVDAPADWNARYPVGTPVRYWPGNRDGAGVVSTTRSPAWQLGNGEPVVSVDGRAGGIALAHVEPLDRTGATT